MLKFNYYSPTEIKFGENTEAEVGALVKKHGGNRVFAIYGGSSAEKSGLIAKVKDALEIAIRNTGGVISSAGIILAATFAALTTMPIADLFVFGFMVAIGILIDTFLVRGMLLPALILFFEKDK